MPDTIAIVGAGHTAVQAIDSLRREGFDGRLVVIGDEPGLPYQRPPLSKKFLSGELPLDRLALKPASYYEAHRVELRLGRAVESIGLKRRQLAMAGGEVLAYDRLLLTTGSVPRHLTVPGHELEGIHYLRSSADVERIRAGLQPGARVVIVGGGYIGLEVAATCRQLGHDVDVLEMTDRVMNRVVAPEVSAFFAAEHGRAGVRIHVGTLVSAFAPREDAPRRVGRVETMEGTAYPADVVIVGVGVLPNVALATAAGLACENGIAVDEHARTSDANVWAAGDCSNHPSLRYHRRIRLESVDNAFEQAKTASINMLGGSIIHDRVPWFWSDQYDLKLLIVGLNFDYDRVVVRGAPETRAFSCCYLRGTELLAMDCVNNAKDYMVAKKLIAERAHCDPERLADPAVALRDTVSS
jgi:3-phenylpropionate/trans-cinnamate dioxygenase ferredoxin reductase subunit